MEKEKSRRNAGRKPFGFHFDIMEGVVSRSDKFWYFLRTGKKEWILPFICNSGEIMNFLKFLLPRMFFGSIVRRYFLADFEIHNHATFQKIIHFFASFAFFWNKERALIDFGITPSSLFSSVTMLSNNSLSWSRLLAWKQARSIEGTNQSFLAFFKGHSSDAIFHNIGKLCAGWTKSAVCCC